MTDVDPPTTGSTPTIDAPVVGASSVAQVSRPGEADGPGRAGSARQRRSEWRRAEKARRYAARNSVRFPIFTRSVLLWVLIFALVGLSFGASGAFWWAHFNTQISQLRADTQDFETRSQSASADIEKQKTDAEAEIDNALKPLRGFLTETQTIQLSQLFSPSVYSVATLDDQGRPSVGTAFSVLTNDTESLMLTSYTTVRAATVNPAPAITLRKNNEDIPASLVNWDPEHDLALLRVAKGGITVLDWAADDVLAQSLATRVFPVSGTGGNGATLTSGTLIDQSSVGFQHTAPLGADFQGGPIVNADGKILGVASLTYSPLGYDNGQIHFSPPIAMACARVLNCGGGTRSQGNPGG
jgi:S1-C subfamily serine protease